MPRSKGKAEGKAANASAPVLIHFYYPPQWTKSFTFLLFASWWLQHTAGSSDGGTGWHQSHVRSWVAVGSFQPTMRLLLNPTSPNREIPRRGNTPSHAQVPIAQCLLLDGHRRAGDIPVRHLSPGDKQGRELYFCLYFPCGTS